MGSNTAGNYIDESLPNIMGSIYIDAAVTGPIGAFQVGNNPYGGETSGGYSNNLIFDASLSSSVYQNGAKVRPDSLTCCYIIKY